MGGTLHSHGKAHFWNPYAPRADFLQHTDGIFAEDSYEDERMVTHTAPINLSAGRAARRASH